MVDCGTKMTSAGDIPREFRSNSLCSAAYYSVGEVISRVAIGFIFLPLTASIDAIDNSGPDDALSRQVMGQISNSHAGQALRNLN